MKAYSNYKDSGVPWLAHVPEHWEAIKTKHLFSERLQKGYPNEPLLAATQTKGVVPKSMYEDRTVEAQKDLHLLKLVEPGDFVISLRSFQGGIEYAYYRGIISPAYTVMVPNKRILPEYYRHLAKSKNFISLLQTCVTGIREGQNINYEILRKTPLPVPTEDEQQQISRYLDWQTSKINQFIKAKKKLIALLKEQKQNIINEAVTKGINPDVKMKDSGVEWLGEIPKHWEVRKIKQVALFNPSKSESTMDVPLNNMVTFLPMKKISINGDISCDLKRPLSQIIQGFTYFKRNDVLVAKITPCFENGKGAFLHNLDQTFGFGTTELFVLRPSKEIAGAYLRIILCSATFLRLGKQHMSGTAGQQRVQSSFIKNFKIGTPPVDEQYEIASFIQNELKIINQTIDKASREIELIQEYRTRLVSDVVTGKVDVRSVEIPDFEAVETNLKTN